MSWHAVVAPRSGYIQRVDNAGLLRLAGRHNAIVRMERDLGDFVVRETPLAFIARVRSPSSEVVGALQAAYSIDRHRTLEQDSAFGIRQIVDIALRALSPSTNDTTTAVMCIDYLSAILAQLATREMPSRYRYDGGELRVIAVGLNFGQLVSLSFEQIRGSAGGNAGIMLRLLGALEVIGSLTASRNRRQALGDQLDRIVELAVRTLPGQHDRFRVAERAAAVHEALHTTPGVGHAH